MFLKKHLQFYVLTSTLVLANPAFAGGEIGEEGDPSSAHRVPAAPKVSSFDEFVASAPFAGAKQEYDEGTLSIPPSGYTRMKLIMTSPNDMADTGYEFNVWESREGSTLYTGSIIWRNTYFEKGAAPARYTDFRAYRSTGLLKEPWMPNGYQYETLQTYWNVPEYKRVVEFDLKDLTGESWLGICGNKSPANMNLKVIMWRPAQGKWDTLIDKALNDNWRTYKIHQ